MTQNKHSGNLQICIANEIVRQGRTHRMIAMSAIIKINSHLNEAPSIISTWTVGYVLGN